MATNHCSASSPCNRNCDQDIRLWRCHEEACYSESCTLIKRILANHSYTEETLDDEYNLTSHIFKEGFRRSLCTIFLVCKHTFSFVTNCLQSVAKKDICMRFIVLCSPNLARENAFDKCAAACIHLGTQSFPQTLKKEVEAIIQDNSSYDDFVDGGDYNENSEERIQNKRYIPPSAMLKSPSSPKMSPSDSEINFRERKSSLQSGESILKQKVKNSDDYVQNEEYLGLCKDHESEQEFYEPLIHGSEFLLLRTLSLSDEQNGVHVDSDCCLPRGKVVLFSYS